MKTAVIVPALNEAGNIAALVHETRAQSVDWVIVVDNGSTDETAARAQNAGAVVTFLTEAFDGLARVVRISGAGIAALGAGKRAPVRVTIDGEAATIDFTGSPRLVRLTSWQILTSSAASPPVTALTADCTRLT